MWLVSVLFSLLEFRLKAGLLHLGLQAELAHWKSRAREALPGRRS